MFRRFALVVAVVGVAACSRGETAPETTVPLDLGPAEVVAELFDAIVEGRFDDAARLTDSSQAPLMALAEGADATEVVESIDAGGEDVASNFWSGFAQAIEPSSEAGSMSIVAGEPVVESGEEFVTVTVTAEGREAQYFVLRHDEVWMVDLMATFAPVLAERLIPPVEALLGSANSDARVVLTHLRDVEPSLNYAFTRPDIPAEIHQAMLGLAERVTRTG